MSRDHVEYWLLECNQCGKVEEIPYGTNVPTEWYSDVGDYGASSSFDACPECAGKTPELQQPTCHDPQSSGT